jgi:hypothetical protein
MLGDYDAKKHRLKKVPYRVGSAKDQIVASDLIEERQNCNFDQEELAMFLDDLHIIKKGAQTLLNSIPETRNNPRFFELSIEEQQQELWKRLHFMHSHPELRKMFFDAYDPLEPPFYHWPFFI